MRRSVRTATLLVITALVVVSFSGVTEASDYYESDSLVTGPYVDCIEFLYIGNQNQIVRALQAGSIQMASNYFIPSYLPALEEDPDIELYNSTRNGYGHISINCAKYPLNISGFRRAFAYAFDKQLLRVNIMDGFSQDHDSLVPYCNQWCIEDDLPWHYYTAQPDVGNSILDELGFEIDGVTGYRNAPNGTPFDIAIESWSYGGGISQIGVDALSALGVNATTKFSDYIELRDRFGTHGDNDMIVSSTQFDTFDIQWLADEYGSMNANIDYKNPTNFRNESFDAWIDRLRYSTTREDIQEAAAAMQLILHENVPRLVVYQHIYRTAYRVSEFAGHVGSKVSSITNQWTFRNIHPQSADFGGTVSVALYNDIVSFNHFTPDYMSDVYFHYRRDDDVIVLDLIYSSLFDRGPDMKPVPDLVVSMYEETHSDNPNVAKNRIRFTMDIVQNATWSDGVPLTADDIVFTFLYMMENGVAHTPFNLDWSYSEINSLWSPTPYRVVIEFSTESYWHFEKFAYEYILPMHIMTNEELMEGSDYLSWNPGINASQPLVTSGPFLLSDFSLDYYNDVNACEFSYNPAFYFAPERPSTETTTTTTTTTTITLTTTNATNNQSMNLPLIFITASISCSGTVIVFYVVVKFQNRKS